jgi:hypothetical protein
MDFPRTLTPNKNSSPYNKLAYATSVLLDSDPNELTEKNKSVNHKRAFIVSYVNWFFEVKIGVCSEEFDWRVLKFRRNWTELNEEEALSLCL